jgi:hypothetical protein
MAFSKNSNIGEKKRSENGYKLVHQIPRLRKAYKNQTRKVDEPVESASCFNLLFDIFVCSCFKPILGNLIDSSSINKENCKCSKCDDLGEQDLLFYADQMSVREAFVRRRQLRSSGSAADRLCKEREENHSDLEDSFMLNKNENDDLNRSFLSTSTHSVASEFNIRRRKND